MHIDYDAISKSIAALTADETNDVALMATVVCELHHADDLYGKLWGLASNLWWSWHPECDQLFRDIDPIRWRVAANGGNFSK